MYFYTEENLKYVAYFVPETCIGTVNDQYYNIYDHILERTNERTNSPFEKLGRTTFI